MAQAILIHLAVSTLSAMLLGLLAGRLNFPVALVSLQLGAGAGFWTWWRMKDDRRLFPGTSFLPGLFYAFIIFAAVQHFLFLLYYDRSGLKTLHLNNFGDLSMHIQYIRHLAGGSRFWPENPEFAGALLTYPIGMDLYNALWEVLGVPIDSHLFVIGVVLTVAAVSMLHRWTGWLGVGAFFLNGGLSNWQTLKVRMLFDFQNTVAWKNFFLSLWITQRGFLFALPAGVYVIKMTAESFLAERNLSRDEKIVTAVLWSGLAWFHLHTFFIISVTLGICILLYGKIRPLLVVIIPVAAAGLVFVFFSTGGFAKASVIHLKWGWVAGGENLLIFWTRNLGPWMLLGAAGIISVLKRPYGNIRPMAAVFFILFMIFTWVMVAPWEWDNIKVLVWLYLMIVWLAWKTWLSRLSPRTALIIACLLFFPGMVSLVSSLPGKDKGAELYRAAELWEAKAALKDLPDGYVLATAPDPNHPAMFWGAKVALGYTGHLWSHGIAYGEREAGLDALFKGRQNWLSLARDIGATHIYWGPNEKRRYGRFPAAWRSELKNVSRSPEVEVFDLKTYQGSEAGRE